METAKPLTLHELTVRLQDTITTNFDTPIWLIAEINSLRQNKTSKHVYLDLIEKSKYNDSIIAQMRAMIWANNWPEISQKFEEETGQELKDGIKVLVFGLVKFHPQYSLSFHIYDIEPSFTIGDWAQRRKEIIQRLEKEGVKNLNKELDFPLVPQVIAIISSPTAAGYEDFINQLENSTHGFKFYHKLFPAIMQGENAEHSIISALEKIFEYEELFDVVVIIRGGGAKTDLQAFDSYELAFNIAQFPLPVLTGIGHTRDNTVTDIVAWKSLKTPTAVANFLIDKTNDFYNDITGFVTRIKLLAQNALNSHKHKLSATEKNITHSSTQAVYKQKMLLSIAMQQLSQKSKQRIQQAQRDTAQVILSIRQKSFESIISSKHKFDKIRTKGVTAIANTIQQQKYELKHKITIIEQNDPRLVLSRGYSITRLNGKAITDIRSVKNGEIIETELFNGKLTSIVKKTEDNENNRNNI